MNALTLHQMLSAAAANHPDKIAIVDPDNRDRFTNGAPRRLTYAQADVAASAIAARLRDLGLHVGSVIALQLPCIAESALSILGILRAGMIPAPLPMLWRETEIAKALAATGAKAIITAARIGTTDHCAVAMNAAAQAFQVRHVCLFGGDAPDGVVSLDDVFTVNAPETIEAVSTNPTRLALITLTLTGNDIAARSRNENEVLAGAAFCAGRPMTSLLTTVPLSSFAGVALGLVPWLRNAATLVLHQPFDPNIFADARRANGCDAIVLPGAMVTPLAEAGLLSGDELSTVVALWRTREQLTGAPAWNGAAELYDTLAVGEDDIAAGPRSKAAAENRYSAAWLGGLANRR